MRKYSTTRLSSYLFLCCKEAINSCNQFATIFVMQNGFFPTGQWDLIVSFNHPIDFKR